MKLPSARSRIAVLGVAIALLAAAAGGLAWWRWEDRYYTASEVDRAAFPLEPIELPYPPTPNGVAYAGTLVMEVFIDREGRVDAVKLLDATVPATYQDIALRAFRAARFGPALRHGRPVRSVKRIEVQFVPPSGPPAPLR